MTRETALLKLNEIEKENGATGDWIFEILSFLEGSSYNSAEAFLAADRLYKIDWSRRGDAVSALNAWYTEYAVDHKDDFEVRDAKQSMDFSMPDEAYVKNVLRRWESRRL